MIHTSYYILVLFFSHLLCFWIDARRAAGCVFESARQSQPTHKNVLRDGLHVCIVLLSVYTVTTGRAAHEQIFGLAY